MIWGGIMSRQQCPSCGGSGCLGTVKCFKCGYFLPWTKSTEGYNLITTVDKEQCSKLNLSDVDFNPDNFPPEALRWLYKSYIYNKLIRRYNIGYHKVKNKVFIPLIDQRIITGYILRKVDKDAPGPKYLTYGDTTPEFIYPTQSADNKILIIVEDKLSALRVSEQYHTFCVFGTHVNKAYTDLITLLYNKVVIWLDPDRPGQEAANKLYNTISKNYQSQIVQSLYVNNNIKSPGQVVIVDKAYDKDPKRYTNTEIDQIIKSTLGGRKNEKILFNL
jgi:5S rRNA maturation endonuclease (ribonuclease M5)